MITKSAFINQKNLTGQTIAVAQINNQQHPQFTTVKAQSVNTNLYCINRNTGEKVIRQNCEVVVKFDKINKIDDLIVKKSNASIDKPIADMSYTQGAPIK